MGMWEYGGYGDKGTWGHGDVGVERVLGQKDVGIWGQRDMGCPSVVIRKVKGCGDMGM